MFAAFRNQKLSLAQGVQHTGANFGASHSLCSIATITGKPHEHFEIDVC